MIVGTKRRNITMSQREIIAEGWADYINGRLSVMDIAAASGCSYETTRSLLCEITNLRRGRPSVVELQRERQRERRKGGRLVEVPSIKRPRGITAAPFSDEWWEQNAASAERHFKACVASGHWQFFSSAE